MIKKEAGTAVQVAPPGKILPDCDHKWIAGTTVVEELFPNGTPRVYRVTEAVCVTCGKRVLL